jgi:hypothetical protein
LSDLARGIAIDARALRTATIASFGASNAEGAWDWKAAYEACEAAQILFLRKFGPAIAQSRHAGEARGFTSHSGKTAASQRTDVEGHHISGHCPPRPPGCEESESPSPQPWQRSAFIETLRIAVAFHIRRKTLRAVCVEGLPQDEQGGPN